MAKLAAAGKAQLTALIAQQSSKAQNSSGAARHGGVEFQNAARQGSAEWHGTAAKRRGTSQQQPSGKVRHSSTVEHNKVVRHSRIHQAAAVKRGSKAAERNGVAWPALQSDQAKPGINDQPPSESDQATIRSPNGDGRGKQQQSQQWQNLQQREGHSRQH